MQRSRVGFRSHCLWFVLADLMLFAPATQAQTSAPLVSVTTSCEAMTSARCQGAFGFVVSPTGQWKAGPDPQSGRSQTGQLTEPELSDVKLAAEKAVSADAKVGDACSARPGGVPGVRETVTVTQANRSVTLHGGGGRIDPSCGPTDSPSAAVFKLVDDLMRRYYPTPF